MNSVLTLYIDSIGWTLIHALWQGSLIWLLFRLTQTMLHWATPVQRHANALLWLVVMLIIPVLTFALHISRDAAVIASVGAGSGSLSPAPGVTFAPLIAEFASRLTVHNTVLPGFVVPALAILWLACVAGRCWRLHFDWCYLNRMASRHSYSLSLIDFNWAPLLRAMNSPKSVQIRESLQARVPMVVGWFKPVILLPTSALLGLSPRELELIVAHELGHIRRHDHRINYLLILAETALFFHPAVFAMTSAIRHERELCVDDLVIQTFKERLCYAHALSKLEILRGDDVGAPSWQVAATDGPLVKRITRLVEGHHGRRRSGGALISAVAVWVLGFAAVIWVQQYSGVNDSYNVASALPDSPQHSASGALQVTTWATTSVESPTVSRLALIPMSLASQRAGGARVVPAKSKPVSANNYQTPYTIAAESLSYEREQIRDARLGHALRDKQIRDQVYALLVASDGQNRVATTRPVGASDARFILSQAAKTSAAAVTPQLHATSSPGVPSSQLEKTLKQQNYLFAMPKAAATVASLTGFVQGRKAGAGNNNLAFDGVTDQVALRGSSNTESTDADPIDARGDVQFGGAIAPADLMPVAFTLPADRFNPHAADIDQYEIFNANEVVAQRGGELLKGRQPRYPTRARGRGLTDNVTVVLSIDTNGHVIDVEVISKASRPMFKRAVVRAVSRWNYAPLLRNGEAVERKLMQSFDFRMDENTTARRDVQGKCNLTACAEKT